MHIHHSFQYVYNVISSDFVPSFLQVQLLSSSELSSDTFISQVKQVKQKYQQNCFVIKDFLPLEKFCLQFKENENTYFFPVYIQQVQLNNSPKSKVKVEGNWVFNSICNSSAQHGFVSIKIQLVNAILLITNVHCNSVIQNTDHQFMA